MPWQTCWLPHHARNRRSQRPVQFFPNFIAQTPQITGIMRKFRLLALLWLLPLSLTAQSVDIRDYGAIGDGRTLNTAAIQAAIDAAAVDGGQVRVPAGRFLSGSIVLQSGVDLHLEAGAVLLGSTDPAHYRSLSRWKALVMAEGAENISITGRGTLDGQGDRLALHLDSLFYVGEVDSANYEFPERRPLAPLRPQIIELQRCQNVRVADVTIQHAACWVQTYDLCRNLTIEGIRVDSDTYWNNDGIDIIDCRDVVIRDCYVNASDDGICLKSYAYAKDGTEFCENILIENCTVRSSASAVKLGTASYGGFRNVTVRNIKVYDTFRSAIALETVGGGFLEDVLVENITAVNTGNAIFIRLGQRARRRPVGRLRDITIRNVFVQVPATAPDADYEIRGPALPFFHNVFPASITGIPGHYVEDVTLENIEIHYPGGGNPAYANLPLWRVDQVPEQVEAYPEFSMFGELPAWGLYLRHVRGITLRNITLRVDAADYRPAIVVDHGQDLRLEQLLIIGDDDERPVYLHQSTGVAQQGILTQG